MDQISRRGTAAGRRRSPGWMLVVASLAACQPPPSPSPAPGLVEPATFATWPRVTEKPVRVSPQLAMLCSALPPRSGAREAAGVPREPHAEYAIVVRVSPEAFVAYRDGRPLPAGAVVVKEKYDDASASGPLQAYGVMIKREAGYAPRNGDWEYAYVALGAERMATRGRMPACANCHASAARNDFLFRSYTGVGR